MILEIVAFLISEVFYFREYVFDIDELNLEHIPHTALIFYTFTRALRIFIDNYLMVVLVLLLEFFISMHIKKKQLQKSPLTSFNKFIIGWVIFLFSKEFVLRNLRIILNLVACYTTSNESFYVNLKLFDYIQRFIVTPFADILNVGTLAYLFYHQSKVNEEIRVRKGIVINNGPNLFRKSSRKTQGMKSEMSDYSLNLDETKALSNLIAD